MQVISRSILPLLRRRNVATGPAQCAASVLPRDLPAFSWPPALARRGSPPNLFGRRVFRFLNASCNMANTSGIKGGKLGKVDNGKTDGRGVVHNGKKDVNGANDTILLCGQGPPGELNDNEEFACFEDEVHDCNCYNYTTEDVNRKCIGPHTFSYSAHRDGSIYKGGCSWKKEYRIADRDEN